MRTAAFRAFLPAIENRRQNFLEPLRLKQQSLSEKRCS
jgi:hypothetical protein